MEISKLILAATKYPETGITNALDAMIQRADNQGILKELEVPVLFIVGTDDEIIPSQYSFNQLVLPTISDIHLLNGIGHMGMIESTEKCVIILKNFIAFIGDRKL